MSRFMCVNCKHIFASCDKYEDCPKCKIAGGLEIKEAQDMLFKMLLEPLRSLVKITDTTGDTIFNKLDDFLRFVENQEA